MPARIAEATKIQSLKLSTRYPRKRVRSSASRIATTTRPKRELTMARQPEVGEGEQHGGDDEESDARRVGLQVEAEQLLEVGEAVVAAEAHLVAEEREQERVGERLRDDREVHAGDARAEGEPPEDECQQAGSEHDHREREREDARSPTSTRAAPSN